MADRMWRSTEVLAWTENEGPRRPPRAEATWIWTTTAATLGIVFSTILFTDTLCPEHRLWVQNLATVAFLMVVVSIVGMARGWAAAPMITVVAAGLGTVIGLIDAAHAPVRGGAIAAGFGLAVVSGGWLAVRQLPLVAWDRDLRRQLTPMAAPVASNPSAARSTVSRPAEEPDDVQPEVHAPR